MTSYSFFSRYYDEIIRGSNYSLEDEIRLIISLIDVFGNGGVDVLEFACGTGVVAQGLQNNGFTVTGVDISQEMLEKAEEKIGKEHCILGDMRNIQLEAKYDVVLCNYNSICHLTNWKDWQMFICNACTHLKPDGVLVFDIITLWEFENIARDYKGFYTIGSDTICLEMHKKKELFIWFIKMFIINKSGSYDLLEEEVREISFEIDVIQKELEKSGFSLSRLEDFHVGEVMDESERVYFVAKKN